MNKINKALKIIKEINAKKFYSMIIMMLFASLFEFIGIGLLVPFVSILTNQDSILMNYLPSDWGKEKIFIYGIVFFFCVYLFKSIYLTFFNYNLNKFVFSTEASLCRILFKKYLNTSYLFHLKNNSATLIRNLTEEIHLFAEAIMLQGIIFLTELIITLLLICFLIFINPQSTILLIILISLIILLFLLIMKKRINSWGVRRQKFGKSIIRQISESFGSLKEILLYKKQDFFEENIKNYSFNKAQSSILQNFFVSVPRVTFEFFAILSILVVSIFMLNLDNTLKETVTFVVIFGIISFRLLPAANRIINFLQLSIYHRTVIDLIYEELFYKVPKIKNKNEKSLKDITFNNKITLKNLSFKYESSTSQILKNISFEIERGQTIGIMGPSGSGKSTLVNLLMGLILPDSGSITSDKVSIFENLDKWQSKIGYVPQDVFLINDTIRNNIAFGVNEDQIDDKKVENIIQRVFLQSFINDQPNKLDTMIGERGINISGGQKQRIGIARALYRNPEILIMDESTNSLDKITENDLINDMFKIKKDFTLVFISHNKEIFDKFDKVVQINKENEE
tara:strand:- start:1301 stop:3001 length:1701 start_codon:yes stop_codon:yes gene_type:complete